METVIKVKNLTKEFKSKKDTGLFRSLFTPTYDKYIAVNEVSFEIKRGEAIGFLGPNGAGKTTTTKMLTGLIYPTSGKVEVLGFIPSERKRNFLTRIGLVMGNKSGLNWDLTANQSFELIQKIYKIEENEFKTRLQNLTELLDINKNNLTDKAVRKLSLGERMKMELIGSILHNPEILFLDEPTIGLDIISKKSVRNFLKNIQTNSNVTLILTSHDMDDIEQICERVIVINKGKKVYDDSITSLNKEFQNSRFVKFIFEEKPDKNLIFQEAEIIEETNDSLLFKVDNKLMPTLISHITSKCNILDIEIISTPLEEMIEEIFRKKES